MSKKNIYIIFKNRKCSFARKIQKNLNYTSFPYLYEGDNVVHWKAYALKFLKLQNLDQIHCRNIELDFC